MRRGGGNVERTLDDIVDTLRAGKQYGRPCSLLIGAGCSVTAGIPTAAGFVELIKEHHPRAYERAAGKTYPHCMAALDTGVRRDLIVAKIREAKINWAHIAIAQLVKLRLRRPGAYHQLRPDRRPGLRHGRRVPCRLDFAASTLFVRPTSPKRRSFTSTARAPASS